MRPKFELQNVFDNETGSHDSATFRKVFTGPCGISYYQYSAVFGDERASAKVCTCARAPVHVPPLTCPNLIVDSSLATYQI